MAYIKKIQISGTTYDIRDNEALHDASAFDTKGSASSALTQAKAYTDSKITAVFRFKGSKETLEEVQALTGMA